MYSFPFGVVPALVKGGSEIPNRFMAVVRKPSTMGQPGEIVRMGTTPLPYGEAFEQAARLAASSNAH